MAHPDGAPVLSLVGKTALVTGGGTGIGKACATALAAAGATVTICGPDPGVLESAAAEMAGPGVPPVRGIVCDVTDEAQVEAAVAAAAADDGRLDVALANAGVPMPGSLLHLTADHWMLPIGVNVLGTAHTIKHAARAMPAGGSIIAISSIASARPASFMGTYSVTKAAIDELVRFAAAELGPRNIRVNGIRPGWVATEAVANDTTPENMAIIRAGTALPGEAALGGLGRPEDIARAVVYFASDFSAWVTGQLLSVCGGSSLPPAAGDFAYIARMLFPDEMARDFPDAG